MEVVVADLPAARADAALLRRVFDNLLSNAFKFTGPRETARIEVGPPDAGATFSFTLYGNGMMY